MCRMSAIIHTNMHDVIFHVIFGCDHSSTLEMVHASAVRLHSITGCKLLSSMMDQLLQRQHSTVPNPNQLGATHLPSQDPGQTCCPRDQGVWTRLDPEQGMPTDVVKALFFLFLNVDMVLKEFVCNPGNQAAFAAAMNVRVPPGRKRQAENEAALRNLHAWRLMGTKPMPSDKALNFFVSLHSKVRSVFLDIYKYTSIDHAIWAGGEDVAARRAIAGL